MATRRGFLRKIISGGAATGLAVAGLKAPEAVSEVAELKRRVGELEGKRYLAAGAPSLSGTLPESARDALLDELATIRQNWSVQTRWPTLPDPYLHDFSNDWRWEPGKMLRLPPSAQWVSVVPTVAQYGEFDQTGMITKIVHRSDVYDWEEEIPDDD